jgi:hypothetical protein
MVHPPAEGKAGMTDGPVARLGHVLGWAGSGVAVLFVMAGAALVGLQAKEVWMLQRAPVAYQVELPSGRVYDALGSNPEATEQQAFDAAAARDAGRPVARNWTVHAAGELEGDALVRWKDLTRRNSPEAREVAMMEAWKDLAAYGGGAFALAVLAFLIGRALRYIFAGPSG